MRPALPPGDPAAKPEPLRGMPISDAEFEMARMACSPPTGWLIFGGPKEPFDDQRPQRLREKGVEDGGLWTPGED